MDRMILARRSQCSDSPVRRSGLLSAESRVRWPQRLFYPCDYLNEVELRRHAEDVVHANGQIERTLAVEVDTVLFHISQQDLSFSFSGMSYSIFILKSAQSCEVLLVILIQTILLLTNHIAF